MSDISDGGQGSEAPASGTAEPVTPTTDQGGEVTQPVETQAQADPNSLAQGFLSQIPEEHRSIVEPYVKQWDAGVTRRFQELHSTYSPFKEYLDAGYDADRVRAGVQLYQMLETNPQFIYNILAQELGAGGQEQGQGNPQDGISDELYAELPPQLQQQLQQQAQAVAEQNKALEAIATWINTQISSEKQQQEDYQLDQYLGLLKTEYGEFDEEWVLTKMGLGMSGEDAIKAFRSFEQKVRGDGERKGVGAGSKAPEVLSGGSVVLPSGADIKTADRKDVRNLVADILEKANQQSQ